MSMYRSGDSTARLWKLGEGGVSGHTSSIVLPHQPVDSSSQQDINRDVTTVHWNVCTHNYYSSECRGERGEDRCGWLVERQLDCNFPSVSVFVVVSLKRREGARWLVVVLCVCVCVCCMIQKQNKKLVFQRVGL